MGDLERITPVAPTPRLEAILARSGLLVDKGAAWLAKRPPRSRTRRRMLSLLLVRGFMAHERKDVELTLLAYEPGVAIDLSGAEGLGLQPRYTGHEAWYELIGDLYENFRDPRYAVTRLVDAGDRVVFEFQFSGTGRVGGGRRNPSCRDGHASQRQGQGRAAGAFLARRMGPRPRRGGTLGVTALRLTRDAPGTGVAEPRMRHARICNLIDSY